VRIFKKEVRDDDAPKSTDGGTDTPVRSDSGVRVDDSATTAAAPIRRESDTTP
jgi:hypothetical protein